MLSLDFKMFGSCKWSESVWKSYYDFIGFNEFIEFETFQWLWKFDSETLKISGLSFAVS